MNWDAVGAVGEIIGALAVLATLAFLAVQIRSNTNAIRSSSEYDIDRRWSDLNFEVGRDPSYTQLWSKILSQEHTSNDFSELELAQVHHLVRGFLQFYQGSFYAFKNGVLNDRRWAHDRAYVRTFVQLPVVNSIVREELNQRVLQPEFAEEILKDGDFLNLKLGEVKEQPRS